MRNKIFTVLVFFLVIITGLLTVVSPQKDVSLRENRTLNKMKSPSVSTVFSGDFQHDFEKGLSDQIFLSEYSKNFYNDLKKILVDITYKKIYAFADDGASSEQVDVSSEEQNRDNASSIDNDEQLTVDRFEESDFTATYVPKGESVFEILETGNLIVFAYEPEELSDMVLDKMLALEDYIKLHFSGSDVDFYVYYLEGVRDIDFKNKVNKHLYIKLLKDCFERIGSVEYFEFNSINKFGDYIYKTDHHWNDKGQKKGYEDIVKLLFSGEEEPLALTPKKVSDIKFVGSRARKINDFSVFDDFVLNVSESLRYDYYENGVKRSIGLLADYMNDNVMDNVEVSHYGVCYGTDVALRQFDFNRDDKDNLLVISDSYFNAINRFVASHFNNTYIVDLRHYKNFYGKEFNLSQFVSENDIDKVLFFSSVGLIMKDEFNFGVDN